MNLDLAALTRQAAQDSWATSSGTVHALRAEAARQGWTEIPMRSTDSALRALRPSLKPTPHQNLSAPAMDSVSILWIRMELTLGGHRIGSLWRLINRPQLPRSCGVCRRAQASFRRTRCSTASSSSAADQIGSSRRPSQHAREPTPPPTTNSTRRPAGTATTLKLWVRVVHDTPMSCLRTLETPEPLVRGFSAVWVGSGGRG